MCFRLWKLYVDGAQFYANCKGWEKFQKVHETITSIVNKYNNIKQVKVY